MACEGNACCCVLHEMRQILSPTYANSSQVFVQLSSGWASVIVTKDRCCCLLFCVGEGLPRINEGQSFFVSVTVILFAT